jgi:predicted outer membrane repeat protein
MNINESKSTFINFNKLKINNINSQGILFRLVLGKFSLKNSEIRNIHRCNINNSCTNLGGSDIMTNTELFIIGSKCEVTIENTIFDNIYGGNGIMISADTTMNLENNTFSNSYFKNGLIMIDNERPEIVISGKYLINNCNFNNIKSEFGSVLHIKSLFESSNTLMEFRNSIFENNTASKYGGVIYSNSEFTNKYIRMYDCTFINNHAQIGHTLYSLNKESEPYISNINELRAIQGSVMTNPTKLILNDNNIKTISLISSDVLPSGISCSIYDDYNNLISFNSDISSIDFDEFMFFGIVSNDTYNVELKGQTQSYCWGDSCTFPSVKIIGNPGSYKIRLIINTFGRFNKFKNSYIDIPIEIKTCNNSYIYQFKESKRLKSCYEPKCELGCNTGECVNINVCNCQNTKFTGKNCDEYFKLERIKILDLIIQIICVILIITIIIILILTILYKNDPIIKGGSIDFLIIILFGLIINIIYTIMLTFERTTTKCYLIYLLNNIGFSLVFGSILVKALRIYKIFHTTRKRNRGIKKSTMYIVVISIVSYHLLISLKWILKEDIKSTLSITSSYKEYAKCVYPTSKKICIIINFAILLIGSWLSYSIRNVKKNFRENLVVPVYVYVLFTIIIEVVNIEEDISIKIQDLFAEIGTIINTFVVLFYLYIDKLYSVYIAIEIENEKTRKSSRSQFGNSSQNLYSNFGSNVYLYSNNGSVPNFKSSSNLITILNKNENIKI